MPGEQEGEEWMPLAVGRKLTKEIHTTPLPCYHIWTRNPRFYSQQEIYTTAKQLRGWLEKANGMSVRDLRVEFLENKVPS